MKEIQLVQLIETNAGIYGLDKNGTAWVYQGHKNGWSKLNMKVMTEARVKQKFAKRSTGLSSVFDDQTPF